MAVILCFPFPLVAFVSVTPWYVPPNKVDDPSFDPATLKKIQTLKVSVRWENMYVKQALLELTAKSKQSDPAHHGVHCWLIDPSAQKVNIVIENTPIFDVLAYIVQQDHLSMKIRENEVVLDQITVD